MKNLKINCLESVFSFYKEKIKMSNIKKYSLFKIIGIITFISHYERFAISFFIVLIIYFMCYVIGCITECIDGSRYMI